MSPEIDATATASKASSDTTEATVKERPGDVPPADKRRWPVLPAGTAVGRFLIIEAVGQGGMGVVYEAYDPRLDRRIAIKLLRTRGARSNAAARLAREAQALARLNHPNVVAIHDVGELDDFLFIAMELVKGATLATWLERGRSWREVVAVMLAAGRGLAAAHQAGIIHRDFKPGNVIVGDDGRVRVLDFGVARSASGEASIDPFDPEASGRIELVTPDPELHNDRLSTPLTQVGTIIGTPAYMAPEQLRGEPVDPRCDQFAYAVTLHRALYGVRPFEPASGEPMLAAMERGPSPPPAGSKVPARLRRVILRGLALEPTARYPTMTALLDELGRDPEASWRRAALAAGATAAIAGGVVLGMRGEPAAAPPCRDAAHALDATWTPTARAAIERAFAATGKPHAADTFAHVTAALDDYGGRWRAMRMQACRATHVEQTQSPALLDLRMACLDRRLDGLGALVTLLGEPLAPDGLDKTVDAARSLPNLERCGDGAALSSVVAEDPGGAELRRNLARIEALELAGRYDEARRALDAALPAIDAAGSPPLLADALNSSGSIFDDLGQAEDAERAWYQAAEAAAAAHDATLEAGIWAQLIWEVGLKQQRFSDAHVLARAARAALARVDDGPLARAIYLGAVGTVHIYEGQYGLAVIELAQALAIRERVLGKDDVMVARSLDALGVAYEFQGRLQDEIVLAKRALAIREQVYGVRHPDVAFPLMNLAEAALRTGALADAEAAARRALAIREETLGPTHEDTAWALFTLGNIQMNADKLDEAATSFARVAVILADQAGPGTMVGGVLRSAQGRLALARNDPRAAAALLLQAAADYEKSAGPEHPDLVTVLTALGKAQHGSGDPRAAIATLERAITVAEHTQADPRSRAEARFELALSRWDQGDHARAIVEATRARADLTSVPSDAKIAIDLAAIDAWLAAHPAR